VLGIVVSEADEASTHVREHLLSIADWEAVEDDELDPDDGGGTVHRLPGAELRSFAGLHLELDSVADRFSDPSLIAVASRHSGDTGPLLTAHHTGNLATAEFGGRDRTLARAAPNAHRVALQALERHGPGDYEVGMECTHHGPSDVGAPSLFVEVGSGPEEWADPPAAEAVARAILALRDVEADVPEANGTRRHLVGFGGGHYAPRYERVVRETDWAVGHVAADWVLDDLGDPGDATDVIEQAFETSAADRALIEGHRPDLTDTIEERGYRVVGETWVRETAGVSLGLVEALESAIGPVSGGLRLGTPAERSADDSTESGDPVEADFVVGTIPAELHETLSGIDREATVAVLDSVALAYDTDHGGSVVEGTVALADRSDADVVMERFVDLLSRKYDDVEREHGSIVARTEQFDPDRAREAGVSPGPDFGRLAEGVSVTVDGETVRPDDVTETVERRLPASLTWA
jgi:D-aminoacyl-tRNA deacylase